MTSQEIIEAVDIVEYISQFTDLELQSDNEYWGLSPLKDEETPSFSVNGENKMWYCFSTGKGGNIVSFVRHYNHCGVQEAFQILEKYLGETGVRAVSKKLSATRIAKKFAHKKASGKKSTATVYPPDYMERFERRPDKLAVWEDEGISPSSLSRFQVAYDIFSDRIVYPIKDLSGNIINISGRTLDPQWKEKKLRKYTYFNGLGRLDTIYGLSDNMEFIKEKKEIILFEGAKSVMLCDTWGVRNTGALLTSHLNPYQMKILARLGVKVVFALDKGINVREDDNIKRLRRFVRVEYIWDKDDLLEDKMSPVDAGNDVWQKLYNNYRFRWR